MTELTKKHYLLRKTLDELKLVSNWNNIKPDLVNLVLKDMANKNEKEGKYLNFGYEHLLKEIPQNLINDLETLKNSRNDNFFDKDLNPKIQEKILEYKELESFKKIYADFYQEELFESMLFPKN